MIKHTKISYKEFSGPLQMLLKSSYALNVNRAIMSLGRYLVGHCIPIERRSMYLCIMDSEASHVPYVNDIISERK